MISYAPKDTRQIGEYLARQLLPGDVILLCGDLGAGKSELTRGIAHGLGIDGPIASPSFTILNVYDTGRYPLYHFDWYRIQSSDELYEMGLDEYLGSDGIAVIEWPERCKDALPCSYLKIHLLTLDEHTRQITVTTHGNFREIAQELKFDESSRN